MSIFLVENHRDTLAYLSSYLRDSGHEVHSAPDMESALQLLPTLRIDILISDIGLPDGDGWQLMRRIGEMGSSRPYGIAMSGHSNRADVEKSRAAGYHHHLIKPFLPDELDAAIAAGGSSLR